MREYMKIVEAFMGSAMPARGFGQKGVAPEPTRAKDHPDPQHHRHIMHARRYPDAEAYARDNNSVERWNTAPANVHRMHDEEHSKLVDRWNKWRDHGYIVPGTHDD